MLIVGINENRKCGILEGIEPVNVTDCLSLGERNKAESINGRAETYES